MNSREERRARFPLETVSYTHLKRGESAGAGGHHRRAPKRPDRRAPAGKHTGAEGKAGIQRAGEPEKKMCIRDRQQPL